MLHKPTVAAGAALILVMIIIPPWTVQEYANQTTEVGSGGDVSITAYVNEDREPTHTGMRLRPIWSASTWADDAGRYEGEIDVVQLLLQIITVTLGTGVIAATLQRKE
jgi:hypothetical protein